MADHPVIAKAKEDIRGLVPGAVEKLGELSDSEHDGIRLAAVKEILDRGGVPTKQDVNVHVDLTMDEEIENLLRTLHRNRNREELKEEIEIEDAIVIEDQVELEQTLSGTGVLPGEYVAPEEPEPEDPNASAWWQAQPEAA